MGNINVITLTDYKNFGIYVRIACRILVPESANLSIVYKKHAVPCRFKTNPNNNNSIIRSRERHRIYCYSRRIIWDSDFLRV